jgi:hypothetical protein
MLSRRPNPLTLQLVTALLALLLVPWLLAFAPAGARAFWMLAISGVVAFDLLLSATVVGRVGGRPLNPNLLLSGLGLALLVLPITRSVWWLGAAPLLWAAVRSLPYAPGPVRRAIATERLLWLGLLRPVVQLPDGATPLTTHQRGGWSGYVWLYVLMEIPIHVLIAFVAPALDMLIVADLLFIAWLAALARSFRLHPSYVLGGVLHLRQGLLWSAEIPLEKILEAEPYQQIDHPMVADSSYGTLQQTPTTLKREVRDGLALIAITAPNLTLRLSASATLHRLGGLTRTATTLHLYLDEPAQLQRMSRSTVN